MSLWGKKENVAGTGTITVAVGNNTVVGVGTLFTTELNAGDTIQYTGVGGVQKLVVLRIANTTSLTVKPTPAVGDNAAGVSFTVNDVPKYLPVTDAINNVEKITTVDASNTDFKEIGVKTPGWVKHVTYTDANSKVRHKTETLVVFKS